jgi:mono/diheme cytochrome c family protein
MGVAAESIQDPSKETQTMTRITITSAAALIIAAFVIPSMAFAGDVEKGKALYLQNCSSCHGNTGAGDGPTGAALPVKPRDFGEGVFKYDTDGDGTSGTDADLTNILKNGAMAYGGSPLMAPLPHLSDENIADIIAFVRSLKK